MRWRSWIAIALQRSELRLLQNSSQKGNFHDFTGIDWKPVLEFLDGVSRSRALQGFTSEQTALFILPLKKTLFHRLRKELGSDANALADEIWIANELMDKLSLHTVKTFQKSREDVILRQQEEMLELSTPVVKLWDGILALPMIGTLDGARSQIVMESLLQRIVESEAEIAITIDPSELIATVTSLLGKTSFPKN